MKHRTSATVTNSSQVSLPARAKRMMGIRPGVRLEVIYDQDSITYRLPKYTFEEVFASVPALPGNDPGDFEEMIQAAQEDHLAEERRKVDAP